MVVLLCSRLGKTAHLSQLVRRGSPISHFIPGFYFPATLGRETIQRLLSPFYTLPDGVKLCISLFCGVAQHRQ